MVENILRGPRREDHVKMGIGEYFWQTASKHGDRIFQIHADTDRKETFAEVKQRTLRVAIQLRKMGINPKDVVMVCCENDLDYVVPVLAASLLGAYVVASIPFSEYGVYGNKIFMDDIKPKVFGNGVMAHAFFIIETEEAENRRADNICMRRMRPLNLSDAEFMAHYTMYFVMAHEFLLIETEEAKNRRADNIFMRRMRPLNLSDAEFMAHYTVIFVVENQLGEVEETIKSMNVKPRICVVGKSINYPTIHEMEKTETVEEHNFEPFKVSIHDIAFILFSSGTSSLPKGVGVSHFTILSGPCRTNSEQSYVRDFPLAQPTVMSWISAVFLLGYCIINAQPRIVAPTFDARKLFELVDKYKMQYSLITYGLLKEMAIAETVVDKYDLSSMKLIISSGYSVDPRCIHKIRKMFPNASVYQVYGSTEMGSTATSWQDADRISYENKPNSVGKVECNVEIKIVDIDTRQSLGPHQQGEILVRSPYRMVRYISQDSKNVFDDEGFLKTGDIGFYDEQGYIYVVDRMNESFKIQGITIYPKIIEELLNSHPSVSESVVFGINQGVGLYDIAACVVLRENAEATAKEISDFIVEKMNESYRLTGGVKFMEKLPMTPRGKVAIRKLKELFQSKPV